MYSILILILYMYICRYHGDKVEVLACSLSFSGVAFFPNCRLDQDETTGLWHLADVNSPDLGGSLGVKVDSMGGFFPLPISQDLFLLGPKVEEFDGYTPED